MSGSALTVKQARFCDEYVVCGNGAEAARRANYSVRTARQMATENLSKPSVQTAIQARQQALAARLELDRATAIAAVLGAIKTAQEQGAPATMIRGWVEIAKITGLDKPETAEQRRNVSLSPRAERISDKFEAMSTNELLEILATKEAPVG